jgi:DNA-binding NarL/FixJ family response regulator
MDIAVVGPRLLIRQALCALLAPIRDFRVILVLDGVLKGFELPVETSSVVFLIDVVNPASDLELPSLVRLQCPKADVLLLSDKDDDEFRVRAFRAGAAGCISTNLGIRELEEAIRVVAEGQLWIEHGAATRIISDLVHKKPVSRSVAGTHSSQLSQRERDVLGLAAVGFRNKEIASRLFISENTVKTHLLTIYRKLEVTGRLEAAMQYFQRAPGDSFSATERAVGGERGKPSAQAVFPIRSMGPAPVLSAKSSAS